MESVYRDIGKHVRAKRLQQDLTLEDLSELAGVHASYIGQIERGTKKFSLKTVSVLAIALGVPIASLFAAILPARGESPSGRICATLRANTDAERRVVIDIIKHLAKGLRRLRA